MKYFIEDNLVVILIWAAIVNIIVSYLIINIATKTNKRAKYDWAQMELLGKIARAQGVSAEEVDNIFKAIK